MSSRSLPVAGRGHPRPVRPEWQLTPSELAAMLARPHFLKFTIERRPRRKVKPALRRISN